MWASSGILPSGFVLGTDRCCVRSRPGIGIDLKPFLADAQSCEEYMGWYRAHVVMIFMSSILVTAIAMRIEGVLLRFRRTLMISLRSFLWQGPRNSLCSASFQ